MKPVRSKALKFRSSCWFESSAQRKETPPQLRDANGRKSFFFCLFNILVNENKITNEPNWACAIKITLRPDEGFVCEDPIKPNQSKQQQRVTTSKYSSKCAACRSFPPLNWGPSSSWSFSSGRLKTTPMMMMMMWLKSKLFGKSAHQFGRGLNRPNNLKTWWDSFHKCNEKIRKDLRAWKDRDSVNNHQGQFVFIQQLWIKLFWSVRATFTFGPMSTVNHLGFILLEVHQHLGVRYSSSKQISPRCLHTATMLFISHFWVVLLVSQSDTNTLWSRSERSRHFPIRRIQQRDYWRTLTGHLQNTHQGGDLQASRSCRF